MAKVVSVSRDSTHRFSKTPLQNITLVAGRGVTSDAHSGAKIQHRSRVTQDPNQPNLRQVHLIHEELLVELHRKGFRISAGDLGENILTNGIDLLALSRGTRLHFPSSAVIEITGLRNPCRQLNDFAPGLMQAVLDYDEDNQLIRKAGIMAVVLESGPVVIGDSIRIEKPDTPFSKLQPV